MYHDGPEHKYGVIQGFSNFFNSGSTLTLRIFLKPTLQKGYEKDLTSNRVGNWSFGPTASSPLTSSPPTSSSPTSSPQNGSRFAPRVEVVSFQVPNSLPPSMEFLSTVSHQTIAEMLLEMYF